MDYLSLGGFRELLEAISEGEEWLCDAVGEGWDDRAGTRTPDPLIKSPLE